METGIVRIVQRAYKIALRPTPEQIHQFNSHAGAARFTYNWALERIFEAINENRKAPNHFTLSPMWTAFKNNPDNNLGWVSQNYVGTYQAALRDAATARSNWAKSATGQRKGRKVGAPKFKSKHRTPPSFQLHGPSVRMVSEADIKPRLGWQWSAPDERTQRRRSSKPKPLHHLQIRGGVKTPDRVRQPVFIEQIQFGLNLPKIGPVAVPLKLTLPGWTDRNRRVARSLNRALHKPNVPCPPCGATGEITIPEHTLKSGDARPQRTEKCQTCDGTKQAPHARIIRVTISRGASGTWWASVTAEVAMRLPAVDCTVCGLSGKVVDDEHHLVTCKVCDGRTYLSLPSKRQRRNGIIGLDLGSRYLAVDSDGSKYESPGYLAQSLAELRVAQQALSRCQPDSKRREKAKRRVGTIHERAALQRRDTTKRLASRLTRNFAIVAVEGWDASRIAKADPDVPRHITRRRNRTMADTAPGMLRTSLQLKAPWVGANYAEAPKHQETARTCPICWTVRTKPVPLHQDEFVCENPQCGRRMDRRVASARVVKALAAGGGASSASGGPVPPKPRGGGVRPDAASRGGGQPPAKRASRGTPGASRKRHKPGSPGP